MGEEEPSPTGETGETGPAGWLPFAGFAGFAAGEMGQGPHSPDMANIPDFSSLTIVPWRRNMAWVAGNILVEEEPFIRLARGFLSDEECDHLRALVEPHVPFSAGVDVEDVQLTPSSDGASAAEEAARRVWQWAKRGRRCRRVECAPYGEISASDVEWRAS